MLLAQLCLSFAAPDPRLLEFTWESDSDSIDTHHAFGLALGQKFGAIIRARFAELPQLKAMMETYKSAQGAALYQSFLDAHEKEAPSAVAELKGIAAGAELPFAQVFLQNIPLEYSDCSAKLGLVDMRATRRPRDDHCSDFQVCAPDGACVVGHNEDNGHADLNRTALVHARFGARAFTAYTYLGELPSGAFGFNPAVAVGEQSVRTSRRAADAHRICCSRMQPGARVRITVYPQLGRADRRRLPRTWCALLRGAIRRPRLPPAPRPSSGPPPNG